jgi:phosphatidylglycerol:prolipoprotein diacylglycerol transferase
MRQTLLLIPHEIAGIPVLGFGWLLLLLVLALAVRLAVAAVRRPAGGPSIGEILRAEGMMWGLVAAIVVFALPFVELKNIDGEPVGMAIRGYGVMLLFGVVAAIALSAWRAQRRGIDPDVIYAMAPWAFIGGIVGARLFFVIQYREQFIGDSLAETLGNIFRFTEGGLVVYGAFIGGFIALTYYVLRHRLSWLRFGDVIVPCLFIGVCLGRIGCLMNGCCYGGRCEESSLALHFPPGSPVYEEQLRSGELLGFSFDPQSRRIETVRPGSLAAEAGIEVGGRLDAFGDDAISLQTASREIPREAVRAGVIATIDGRRYRWSPEQLPARALPVVAAQPISSLGGLALCLALCGLSWFPLRDGSVMMLGFAGYAVLRFVLELLRDDEAGQFGTALTISQWVSLVVLACAMVGLVWVYRIEPRAPLQPQATSRN